MFYHYSKILKKVPRNCAVEPRGIEPRSKERIQRALITGLSEFSISANIRFDVSENQHR